MSNNDNDKYSKILGDIWESLAGALVIDGGINAFKIVMD